MSAFACTGDPTPLWIHACPGTISILFQNRCHSRRKQGQRWHPALGRPAENAVLHSQPTKACMYLPNATVKGHRYRGVVMLHYRDPSFRGIIEFGPQNPEPIGVLLVASPSSRWPLNDICTLNLCQGMTSQVRILSILSSSYK